ILAARLLQIGIARADAKINFCQTDEPLEVVILGITSADACFMDGSGYCVLFCHRSAGTHCDSEKGHSISGFWRVGGGLFVGGVDGHRSREGCGHRCRRRGLTRSPGDYAIVIAARPSRTRSGSDPPWLSQSSMAMRTAAIANAPIRRGLASWGANWGMRGAISSAIADSYRT